VKPAFAVGVGDVLTFARGEGIRVIRIVALASRRGPATEALALYDDLTVRPEAVDAALKPSPGRPGRKERQIAARLKAAI